MKKKISSIVIAVVVLLMFPLAIVLHNILGAGTGSPGSPGSPGNPGNPGDPTTPVDPIDPGDPEPPVVEPAVMTFLISKVFANLTSPQAAGTKIRLNAMSNGGTGVLYQYFIDSGEGFEIVREYRNTSYYDWTPAIEGNYKIKVWAKRPNSENVKDGERTMGFTIGAAAPQTKGTYTIELERWGIDGDPVNNSVGINNALMWASQDGYTEIKFPTDERAEYVISEYMPINIQNMRNVVINLNYATLRINPNGLLSNSIIGMFDIRNVILKDGTVLGDIYDHDYDIFPKSSTEGNLGILVERGVVGCQIDNVLIKDITGWGIVTSIGTKYESKNYGVSKNNLESGSIDLDTGVKFADATKIRTINPIEISEFNSFEDKFFILGYDLGYMNNPYMSTRIYDAIFYAEDKTTVIGSASGAHYKKMYFTPGTHYVDFIYHQPNVPTGGDGDFGGAVAFIRHRVQPDIKITNCVFDRCRSLGMAICGGDGMIVENCTFKNIYGLAPAKAVDFEDGWEYMNNIKFINNTFENNTSGDLVVCAGDNFLFTGNKFSNGVYFYARTTNYTFVDNTFEYEIRSLATTCGVTFRYRSNTVISGNEYKNAALGVTREGGWGELKWDHEELTDSSVNNMTGDDAILYDSTIYSRSGATNRFGGKFIRCEFTVEGGSELLGLTIENSKIYKLSGNNQQSCSYINCKIYDTFLTSTSSTGTILIKDSEMTNSYVYLSTWAGAAAIDIQNCDVLLMENATRPFVSLSAGKARDILLRGNRITNMSTFPIVNIYDLTYTTPNALVKIENNIIMQDSGFILTCKKVTTGTVKVFYKGNTITGGVTGMIDGYNDGNPLFIVTTVY